MASKTMLRSCGSSVRSLINRHLRPTAAASNIQTESPVNKYLLPNSFVQQPVNIGYGFGRDVAGYSVLEEIARGRQKFEAAHTNFDDDKNDYTVSDLLDDDDDYGSGDNDFGTDDD